MNNIILHKLPIIRDNDNNNFNITIDLLSKFWFFSVSFSGSYPIKTQQETSIWICWALFFYLGMFLFFLRTPPIFLSAGEQTEEANTQNRERRSLKTFGTMKCLTIRKQEVNCGIRFTALMIHNVHCTWRVKNTHSYGRINGWLKESVPKCTRGPQESLKVWSCFFQHSTFTFLFHAFTVQSVHATREAGWQWWIPPPLPPICTWCPPPPPTWCTPPLVT